MSANDFWVIDGSKVWGPTRSFLFVSKIRFGSLLEDSGAATAGTITANLVSLDVFDVEANKDRLNVFDVYPQESVDPKDYWLTNGFASGYLAGKAVKG